MAWFDYGVDEVWAVKVGTFAALTRVGSTDEYTVRDGLIPYEWVVTEDSNENAAKSGLIRNFPADTEGTVSNYKGTLQPLELEVGNAATALLYITDYTVDWVKGSITLTSAGATKVGANGVKAKYSYATNIAVWDASLPNGVTFIDHLYDLRFKISDIRRKVKDRHYEPEALCMNFGLMDKISAGKAFSNEGGNAANSVDMDSVVTRYAGCEPIDSTAIPIEYVVCAEKMAALFGMHTPFTMTGQVYTDNTGNQRHFGEQFAGFGVPAPEKGAVCIVQNLPS